MLCGCLRSFWRRHEYAPVRSVVDLDGRSRREVEDDLGLVTNNMNVFSTVAPDAPCMSHSRRPTAYPGHGSLDCTCETVPVV